MLYLGRVCPNQEDIRKGQTPFWHISRKSHSKSRKQEATLMHKRKKEGMITETKYSP